MDDIVEYQERAENQESLGTAKWADPGYIAKKYRYQTGDIWLGRNPHNHDQAIGCNIEKHVFICAEGGGGKGRSFMVNNQVLWPGSMVAIGPKGDEATMGAVRRGQGNAYCDGLGQEVYVIDPMRITKVPEQYLAYYDLLEGLQPDDPYLVRKSTRIADAICKMSESGGDGKDWDKRGRQLIARIIQHVVTFKYIAREDRNLLTVRKYAMVGNVKGAEKIHAHKLKEAEAIAKDTGEDFDPASIKRPDPYRILLQDMQRNDACGGKIKEAAEKLFQTMQNSPRQFEGIRGSAGDLLEWMEGDDIESVMCKREDGPQRSFHARDLKDRNISVFISLPENDYEFLGVWLRAMIVSLLQELNSTQGVGANRRRVLFSIDEFGNLPAMDELPKSFNAVRSAGVSLMVATQGLVSIQEKYPKSWQRFPSAAGIEVYFQADEPEVGQYLEKKLGKKEVVKYGRSINANKSYSVADAITESYSYSNSLSKTETEGTSEGDTVGSAVTTGKGGNRSKSRQSGRSGGVSNQIGHNTSRGYGPGVFHLFDITHTLQRGDNSGRGSHRGHNKGSSSQRGESWQKSNTRNESHTRTRQLSSAVAETSSQSRGQSTSKTETTQEGKGAGVQESFQTKPLLSIDEARKFLISPEELDHPAYPGMALIMLDKEPDPFFVRKCNYDEDPFFVRKFSPNPAFQFLALEDQRLKGYEITPAHFLHLEIPEILRDEIETFFPDNLEEGEYLEADDYLVRISNPYSQQGALSYKAMQTWKVIDIPPEDEIKDTGKVLTLRAEKQITPEMAQKLERHFWQLWIDERTERKRIEREEQERKEREEQAERERKDREAELRRQREAKREQERKEARLRELENERTERYIKNGAIALVGMLVFTGIMGAINRKEVFHFNGGVVDTLVYYGQPLRIDYWRDSKGGYSTGLPRYEIVLSNLKGRGKNFTQIFTDFGDDHNASAYGVGSIITKISYCEVIKRKTEYFETGSVKARLYGKCYLSDGTDFADYAVARSEHLRKD